MLCWRNPLWTKITLFFFTTMFLYQPAFAGLPVVNPPVAVLQLTPSPLPIAYVNDAQAQQLALKYQHMGYAVKQGTLAQLHQLLLASNNETTAQQENTQDDTSESPVETKAADNETGCIKPGAQKPLTDSKSNTSNPSDKNKNASVTPGNNAPNESNIKQTKQPDCTQGDKSGAPAKPMAVQMPRPAPSPATGPESAPAPAPVPAPPVTVQPAIDLNVDILKGSGGSNSDAAKVFFIITGIVVVAAFVVYAGKYLVDIAQGNQHDLWWEVIFNSTYLDTNAGQNGRFTGVKLATGFVSSDLIQIALVGEVGNADLNLLFNEYSNPLALDFTTPYWMLGATARLMLSRSRVNASYLYMDFMGGKTSRSETDSIGATRVGASFGINDYVRLGINYGAQYIGLNSNQGFVDNSGEYWYTLGVEMGVRF